MPSHGKGYLFNNKRSRREVPVKYMKMRKGIRATCCCFCSLAPCPPCASASERCRRTFFCRASFFFYFFLTCRWQGQYGRAFETTGGILRKAGEGVGREHASRYRAFLSCSYARASVLGFHVFAHRSVLLSLLSSTNLRSKSR